ncbi:restriction endonuclease subunit S [Bacteroides ndongoniae]|uniref:restriction endonuclease subunit S n=1 Tax=Bacteroides ndongoniae TaxID=1903262 RepID=UPI0013564C60|nr:restriction endonuclease subunit S [Bacteroides ndongoniae]
MENRYDKYKDSGIVWIGEIPEHWEKICLKRLSNINTGNQDTQDSVPDGKYPFFVRSPKVEKSNKYTFEGASILMAGDGVGAGKVFHLADDKFACHQRVYCINQFKNINRIYLFYYLSSLFYHVIESANSKSTVDSVRLPMLAEFTVFMPLDFEQQSIATYLDQKCSEIDELITLQEEMITKLQSYKQSVITEAVTKGLDKNVPLKDSGIEWIGEIPEHWICTVFKKFLSEPMQYGANEPAEECNYNDPRYIRITDIKDDGTLRDDTFKSLPLEKAKEYMLTKGDLLFARSGATVGKTFLYKEDYAACFAGYLIKARCNKNELLPNFVFYYTLSNVYQNWKNSIFIQSTIQNIGADKYSVMPIIVPPLSEQQSIATYLDQKCFEIDELISIKQQKIEKLKDYKKSLIFECVTGKRKV